MNLNKALEKLGLRISYDPDFMDGEYTVDCPETGYHIHVSRCVFPNEEQFIAAVFQAVYDVVKYRNDPNFNGFLKNE